MKKVRELLNEAERLLKVEEKVEGVSAFTESEIENKIFNELKRIVKEAGGVVSYVELNESVGGGFEPSYLDFDIHFVKDKKVAKELEEMGFSLDTDEEDYRASLTIKY